MPSGNVLSYVYRGSQSNLHDDEASRVSQIKDGAVVLAEYAYNGLADVVGIDYAQPNIMWEMFGASTGEYLDLDRFNRVTSSRWTTDLSTDKDFLDFDITYDRNSNITLIVDNVHIVPDSSPDPAVDDHIFDWSYDLDDLNRLKRSERGDWSGSAITSQQEDQTWTLDQAGNWDRVSLDLDADDVYTGADEFDDDRTHNVVNELTGRDTDDDGTDDHTLAYDALGNLTDDDDSYEYVYDPFGRLKRINDQSSNLIAEYKYNGLGHLIAVHEDTDADSDVDASDKWFYPVHDERWRLVAKFRDDDIDPKEEFVNQEAGLDGAGGSSFINDVVLRDRDANTAWTSAADGTLEERIYLCQNWRGDVCALVESNGDQVEQVRYSPYGTPFGLPGGDCNSDGVCDSGNTVDSDQTQTWLNSSAYDVRGDVDLDGDVDSADKSAITSSYSGVVGGRSVLTSVGNTTGWAGSAFSLDSSHTARKRSLSSILGRWNAHDSMEYAYSFESV